MSFDRLHPAIQHHVVNTLGWRELRALQSEAIAPLLEGKHALLLAPTAGGKTEAAVLPLMSRMTTECWSGLSLLYLCPIKALLNNLHTRLDGYLQLIGRRAAVWHGDVTSAERRQLLREPPDCLLTTPESLELMLVSSTTDERALFAGIRAVVIDEIHSFAGDDRGWHLLCVLSRIGKLARAQVQRVGLSATVGNPDDMLNWLASHCPGERAVVSPTPTSSSPVEVTLDAVGSVDNAAFVVSQLHKGEKRLVFCDSRSRTEQIATRLRSLGVTTYVSHSSLSADERRQAEAAFASGSNCVIVATSTLELGIDVGDLDRVIQIDAPGSVRSFLQRLGRTGRRSGSVRNCLFLATNSNALLQAAGLIRLWRSGYVEPVLPPPQPVHVLCQQVLALALQEQGIERDAWRQWLLQAGALAETPSQTTNAIVSELISQGVLWDNNGVLWFGPRGEQQLSYRAFSTLLSVFTSEPLLTATHGRIEVGHLHPLSLSTPSRQPRVVLLGGRSWQVVSVDWQRRTVTLQPSGDLGRSLWRGSGSPLSEALCGAMRKVLTDDALDPAWSKRARDELLQLREQHDFLSENSTTIRVQGAPVATWWTFAGMLANDQIAMALQQHSGFPCRASNLSVEIDGVPADDQVAAALNSASDLPISPAAAEAFEGAIKFVSYIPQPLRSKMASARLSDTPAVARLRATPVTWSVDNS